MKLSEEDTSKVFCKDMPETEEYSSVIHAAQDAGRSVEKDFKKSQEASGKAWHDISYLMAACIARGMRLQKEKP